MCSNPVGEGANRTRFIGGAVRAGDGWMPSVRRFRQYIRLPTALVRNNHDLAEMLLRCHPHVSPADVAEREHLVQDRAQ